MTKPRGVLHDNHPQTLSSHCNHPDFVICANLQPGLIPNKYSPFAITDSSWCNATSTP